MSGILDWDLVRGAVPAVITTIGTLAGATLLARRERRWWTRTVPLIAAGSVLACLLIWWIVDGLWQPFPDSVPFAVMAWIGAAFFAAGLAVATLPVSRWRRRSAALLAALLVVITSGAQVNVYYGQFPSLRAAFGLPPGNEIDYSRLPASSPSPFRAQPGHPLADGWRPPADMPRQGAVTQVAIPPQESKFNATRNAYLYVPPAYQTRDRPLLPVLVLLHGQPGGPSDWINGGQIATIMDRFAEAHNGLAPVVVMPDTTGTAFGNPLCLDSRLGASETYLTRDVPAWIGQNLQIDTDTRHWAVAGFSYGGTCALQFALRKPDLFPTFVDMSGQEEPTLGNRKKTVTEAFGGDEAAFRAVNPLDMLTVNKYPRSAGVITVAVSDSTYRPQQRRVFEAAKRNGMDVTWLEVPGSHNWHGWAGGLTHSLGWLMGRIGLTAS
ncbi:enterochelin esterase-like enzyme [Kibdelosporangium banguiense]|uniref:Enterochelin esterase-like enzyme n=1 Tax=Kibdelosporangium banguiense TaxID=1365924 RepID=A0ABS4TRU5_9PSEU|nr:alpha/beta fold hydrolase [Kibdelosporangium banguiense]MBP2326591.1 enterochelin esterase-like enzyme [Kibdelosporangium banguiense]